MTGEICNFNCITCPTPLVAEENKNEINTVDQANTAAHGPFGFKQHLQQRALAIERAAAQGLISDVEANTQRRQFRELTKSLKQAGHILTNTALDYAQLTDQAELEAGCDGVIYDEDHDVLMCGSPQLDEQTRQAATLPLAQ